MIFVSCLMLVFCARLEQERGQVLLLLNLSLSFGFLSFAAFLRSYRLVFMVFNTVFSLLLHHPVTSAS